MKIAAFLALGVGAALGLVILALTGHWWLGIVGLAAIAAAWFYTGGRRPYGYAGYGEVGVFVFFGLVATLGTQYIQADTVTWPGALGTQSESDSSPALFSWSTTFVTSPPTT